MIIYPTDTLYGLGADPLDSDALKKIWQLKQRPEGEPIAIALPGFKQMDENFYMDRLEKALALHFLPGPLTLLLKPRSALPELLVPDSGRVGVRIPRFPPMVRLLQDIGMLTATSANIHGCPAPLNVKEAIEQFGDSISLALDAGELPGVPSTVVVVEDGGIKVIRGGAIPSVDLDRFVQTLNDI